MDDYVLENKSAARGSIGAISQRDFVSTTMSYHNISYTVPVKEKRKKIDKLILDDCSGVMRPGLNAILGPTGSGKTSLLDILAARKDKRFLSGSVLVNGERQQKDFRLMSGFVVQDDTVWGTLSIRENLMFSASLRLGRNYSDKDRAARVDAIIEDLGLEQCADTKVGNDEFRGISGGERKRTCIGMELITNPDVLFLDEPTTGLDATTAVTVIELLQKQAKRLRTVIFSIHQPRYSIFKLFDHVTLMSRGRMVYAGPRDDVINYFDDLGYKCEMYNNPADHVMDVIIQSEKSTRANKGTENIEDNETTGGTDLAYHYRNSQKFKEVLSEVESSVESLKKKHGENVVVKESGVQMDLQYQASFPRQFAILCKRTLKNIFRDPQAVIGQFSVQAVMGLIIGAIYYNVGFGIGGLQNRIGFIFFMLTQMVWGNMNAVTVFLGERRIFRHERANGYYRVSAFFLAKVLCDLIPMRIIPTTTLAIITYFLVGLQPQVDKFFIFLLSLIMTTLPAASICIFVSSSTSIYAVANILVSVCFIIMMVFGGFLVRPNDIPIWLRWLKYFSVFKYGQINLELNELYGMEFNECGAYKNTTCGMSGDDYLLSQDIHNHIRVSDSLDIDIDIMWVNVGALAAITVLMLLFTYMQLRRIKIVT